MYTWRYTTKHFKLECVKTTRGIYKHRNSQFLNMYVRILITPLVTSNTSYRPWLIPRYYFCLNDYDQLILSLLDLS